MDTTEIIVTVSGVLVIAFILWFFFGPKKAASAAIGRSGVQEVNVVVKGGYFPDYIELQQGRPVRLNFLRKESNSCTEQVVLPDFGVVRDLPKDQTTAVEFTPTKTGTFPFHCAMNMVRGQIIVKPTASS